MATLPRLLFLVPAHNEELLVASCIESLQRLQYPTDLFGVIVIADNCDDSTAEIVADAGVEVWERADLVRRGKSEALGWAIARLNLSEWDSVVVLDADSIVEAGFAQELAASAPLEGIVVQANFGSSNEFDNWLTRLSGVLGRIRYEIEYPGKQSRGLNVPLTGNGMCIGARILAAEGWLAESITENWELYARWTASGVSIKFARQARLFSQEAGSLRQSESQRLRWASGRAEVFRKWSGRIARSEAIGVRQKLDALWTLGAPSPVIGVASTLIVGALAVAFLPEPYCYFVGSLSLLPLLVWLWLVARILRHHPQRIPTLFSFLMLLPYAGWRALLQVKALLTGTRAGWIRTARE